MTLANEFTHDARVYNEAQSLLKKGHEVTVLAWDRDKQQPIADEKNGIKIERVTNTELMDIIPYDLFRLPLWYSKGFHRASKLHKQRPYDVVHCHNLDTLPIGVKIKKTFSIPLIYDAHEIWGYMIEKDLHKIGVEYYLHKEKRLLHFVDQIITVAEPHKEYFKKLGREATIVSNCKPLRSKTYEPPTNNIFTLLYIGSLNKARFLQETIEVCRDIKHMQFIIGGFGVLEASISSLAKQAPLHNIIFKGKIPLEQVIEHTCNTDAILCMLDPKNKNNQVGPPNKLFEAMVCGRPVIATKGTYSGSIVKRVGMGCTIDFSKESLKKAILDLRDHPEKRETMGKKALHAALSGYNWKEQEHQLHQAYQKIIKT